MNLETVGIFVVALSLLLVAGFFLKKGNKGTGVKNKMEIAKEQTHNIKGKEADKLEHIKENKKEDGVNDIEILQKNNIKLNLESVDKVEAIKTAGQLLVDSGYVEPEYIQAMLEREEELTTYIGKGIAIPHGAGAARANIKKSGIVVLQYPNGVFFGNKKAYLVIGIAGVKNEHLTILSKVATQIENDDAVDKLITTKNPEYIYKTFTT